jgi:hypothetical protein
LVTGYSCNIIHINFNMNDVTPIQNDTCTNSSIILLLFDCYNEVI